MAMSENVSQAAMRFSSLPVTKQVGLLVALAASIAIAILVVLWSREPIYRPLFSNLNSADAAEVVDVLQRNGIEFKINKDNGTIMVTTDDIYQARMKLAAEGLPKAKGNGFEIFADTNSFNSSQFIENARYRHALEIELSRTISRFNQIKTARVHLAIPRETAFLRNEKKPKASVFVDVYSGMELNKLTVSSIINLVASSVTNLSSSDVTVVDQHGQLLNEGSLNSAFAMSDKYFDYRTEIERAYANKIQEILEPIFGVGKIKAKVSADIDYTSSEQTRELYNPDLPALRSEQVVSEKRSIGDAQGGVAGASSNQPTKAAKLETSRTAKISTGENGESDYRKQAIKNYELDKTISHTKQQPGRIDRLTVAVLVDNKSIFDEKTGATEEKALTDEELNKIRVLVSDTIGLNIKRGDSLNVVNVAFNKPAPIEPIPELPLLQQDWFWQIAKQLLGGIFVLLLVFGILKPAFKSLVSQSEKKQPNEAEGGAGNSPARLEKALDTTEAKMDAAKEFASNNPRGVAEVVKTWVDGG